MKRDWAYIFGLVMVVIGSLFILFAFVMQILSMG